MFVRCISFECVSKIKSVLSIIFHAIYGGAVCIQLNHLSYDDYENMCSLSDHIYAWLLCYYVMVAQCLQFIL